MAFPGKIRHYAEKQSPTPSTRQEAIHADALNGVKCLRPECFHMHELSPFFDHARAHPEAVAMRCTQRITSYRKLTSRIERATARLQGEWNIRPGEMVAYCGSGHQDAVVLFFALLRCGADLMVVPANAASLASLLGRYHTTLLLNDNGDMIAGAPCGTRVFPLHTIIATRCDHEVASTPEQVANRLLRVESGSEVTRMETRSSHALFAGIRPRSDTVRVNAHQLFDDAVFSPVVLSVLTGGGIVHID